MMVAENAPGISQVMMHAFGIALNDGRLIVDHLFEGAVPRVDRARQARLRHDRKTIGLRLGQNRVGGDYHERRIGAGHTLDRGFEHLRREPVRQATAADRGGVVCARLCHRLCCARRQRQRHRRGAARLFKSARHHRRAGDHGDGHVSILHISNGMRSPR
jgi:hypothetical protein